MILKNRELSRRSEWL